MRLPRVRSVLYIDGFDCSPDDVTMALGVAPSRMWRVGESIGRTQRLQYSNGWVLESESFLEDDDVVEHHVVCLLDQFPKGLAVLDRLSSRFEVQLSLVIEVANSAPPLSLSRLVLARIASLGASLDTPPCAA